MRMANINKRKIWYAYYLGSEEVVDGEMWTGEFEDRYSNIFETRVNFNVKSNIVFSEKFGDMTEVDLIIVGDKNIPFNEDTVVWTYRPETNDKSKYEYKVEKIIPSINYKVIGLKLNEGV